MIFFFFFAYLFNNIKFPSLGNHHESTMTKRTHKYRPKSSNYLGLFHFCEVLHKTGLNLLVQVLYFTTEIPTHTFRLGCMCKAHAALLVRKYDVNFFFFEEVQSHVLKGQNGQMTIKS